MDLEEIFNTGLSSTHHVSQCAPSIRIDDPLRDGFSASCFKQDEIRRLVHQYNLSIAEYMKIPLEMDPLIQRQKLLGRSGCTSDACLVDQYGILRNRIKPKGHLKWLSNLDIDLIMSQYQEILPGFQFYGAMGCNYYEEYPEDFPDTSTAIDFAWIFNTDKIHQSGRHWVAVYVHNRKGTVQYFDSTGKPPNKCTLRFITRYFGSYHFSYSPLVHQLEDNECGIYSIYWLLAAVRGDEIKARISDRDMHYFRAALFR